MSAAEQGAVGRGDARLDACRAQLDTAETGRLEDRAAALEAVHGALVAELDDLLDSDRQR